MQFDDMQYKTIPQRKKTMEKNKQQISMRCQLCMRRKDLSSSGRGRRINRRHNCLYRGDTIQSLQLMKKLFTFNTVTATTSYCSYLKYQRILQIGQIEKRIHEEVPEDNYKRTVDFFTNFKFNCLVRENNLHYYQTKGNFKKPKPVTVTRTKRKKKQPLQMQNSQLSTHCITQLLHTMPQLYLIAILMLSLLTVKYASCQQQRQVLSYTDAKTTSTTLVNRQLINQQIKMVTHNLQSLEIFIAHELNESIHIKEKNINNKTEMEKNFQRNTTSYVEISQKKMSSQYKKRFINNRSSVNIAMNEENSEKWRHSQNIHSYSQLNHKIYSLIALNKVIYNQLNINVNKNNNIIDIKDPQRNNNLEKNVLDVLTLGKLSKKFSNIGNRTLPNTLISGAPTTYIDDTTDDVDNEKEDDIKPNSFPRNKDNIKLMHLVMDGLGLQKLPNMAKVNISQQEYATKYQEYIRRVHERKRLESTNLNHSLHIISFGTNGTMAMSPLLQRRQLLQRLREKRDMHNTSATSSSSNDFPNNFGKRITQESARATRERTQIQLYFSINLNSTQLRPGDIEEANIRLMLLHSFALASKQNLNRKKSKRRQQQLCENKAPKQQKKHSTAGSKVHSVNLKVYQLLEQGKRLWLDGRRIEIDHSKVDADDTHSQWLQFDVTKAVVSWLTESEVNLGLEVQCDNCQRIGARIVNDISSSSQTDSTAASTDEDESFNLMPMLNIIGRLGDIYQEKRTRKHPTNHNHNTTALIGNRRYPRIKNCHKANQRCCRHTMEVVFKEIKGFEFIIQPKVFDAGYCRGRCPPRYNPAHHHAMLQSLIFKQSRERAPRPCCAPSKLVELEVLHVDEKDSEKLKISTWTDMRVVECACS